MNQHLHTGAAGLLSIVITAVALLGPSEPSSAAQLKQARVTHIVREVNILPTQAAPRPAQLNDEVRDDTAVRTGGESRTELTFTDQTIARLGANTIFSFDEGSRNMDLLGGAMLLRVPKDAGGAKITTAAVTAAITGTTVMLEYNPDAYVKFIVLEGTARIFLRGVLGESVLVSAGQMLMLRVNPKPKSLPDPVDIDLGRILATSLLIRGFPPLGSETLMATNVRQQAEQKAEGTLIDTNLVIFGGGTLVTLADPTSLDAIDQKPDFTPTPTPQSTPTPSTPTPPPRRRLHRLRHQRHRLRPHTTTANPDASSADANAAAAHPDSYSSATHTYPDTAAADSDANSHRRADTRQVWHAAGNSFPCPVRYHHRHGDRDGPDRHNQRHHGFRQNLPRPGR
jgi:hypothetical protein